MIQAPALTVVIATHERRDLLRRCLDALARQTQDPETFEVVVADDGSEDGTTQMVTEMHTPFRLRALPLAKVGKSPALNAGIEIARGESCLFLDDDVVAAPDLVAEHVAAHQEHGCVLALGRLTQQPPEDGDLYSRAFAEAWNERYEERETRGVDWADCYGGNFSAPRSVLAEIGGFATDMPAVEDIEIGFRLCEAGCTARYLPQASAVHDDRKPGRRILAAEEVFGSWCAHFVKARPTARRRLIGWFDETTPREVALRRLLLSLRTPAFWLARLSGLIPGEGPRRIWLGFVSRYAFWRGVRRQMDRDNWLQTTRGVPVLMYHAFTDSGEIDRYVLPAASFARQMRLLSFLRYRVISLEDVARRLREGSPLPRRTVALTIDDGYRDNFEIAFPILRRHGFTATIYLVSRRLGGKNDWGDKGPVSGRALLTLEQIEEMADGGISFGAHTRHHCSLTEASDQEVDFEVKGSLTDLQGELESEIETFAYPYGRYDARSVSAADRARFLGACTTDPRPVRTGDDPLLMPRIEIRGSDSVTQFLRKLWIDPS